jgi:flagellar motor switch protein FliG
LLDLMSDDEVRKVGMAMAAIDRVEPPDIERIVGDFVRELYEVSLMPRTGPEFVNKVLPELLEAERRETILPILRRRVNTEFADFITSRPAEAVAAIMADELPQTQAVALSLMGPDNAARVMKLMAEEDKGEVTVRMARLKRIPGELIDDVTLAITGALGRDDDFLDVGGVDRTARMLGRLPKTENDRILEVVADEDNPLAERLRRRMVLFGDLMTLTNRGIQALLKQVDRDDLILALKGGTVAEVDRFLENVSSRAAEDIREEIEIMGPVPKSRTRSAQERIVATALKLAEEGSIYLAIGANEDDEDE